VVPGQSGVVELDDRVCFFKLLHRESKQVQEFDQVKEQLRAELEEKKRRQALNDLHKRLRAASEVKVNQRVWEHIYNDLVEEEASEA
jgi:hypothetical protein